MKTLLLVGLIALSFVSFAQKKEINDDAYGNAKSKNTPVGELSVNNVPIRNIDAEYIQIVGTGRFMSRKITIEINFGQEDLGWTQDDTKLVDASGKRVVFNSMIDALNFMSKQGYGFVQAYTLTAGNESVYHFLMRRNK